MQAKILVVDDEPDICELIILTLHKMNIDGVAAHSIGDAKKHLKNSIFTAILTDLRLPDGDGASLVEYVMQHHAQTPIAVITAHGNMEIAIDALKKGAFDFVAKPINIDVLRNLLQQAINLCTPPPSDILDDLIGQSPIILDLKEKVAKVARSQAPIYISGPSGSGKELVARLIHKSGNRQNHPFIPINCGAIPTDLMESEFFGHTKGSFTGAHHDKAGLFRAADKGTLFLDEVADLTLEMQVKLLRALQEKTIRPIGANQEVSVDIRILSATHKDLAQLVKAGLFREDLYYRINVIELKMPSLSQRMDDLKEIIDHLLEKIAMRHQTAVPNIAEEAIAHLKRHRFPGNVRELENILERAFTLSDQNIITLKDIDLEVSSVQSNHALTKDETLDEHIANVEKNMIIDALDQCNGNVTQAAKKLGISFRTLRYRLKKLDINFKDAG